MKLPVNPGEKYALIALNAATTITEPLELGEGLHALPGGSLDLPEKWRVRIGSLRSERIEGAGLLILAKRPPKNRTSRTATTSPCGTR